MFPEKINPAEYKVVLKTAKFVFDHSDKQAEDYRQYAATINPDNVEGLSEIEFKYWRALMKRYQNIAGSIENMKDMSGE